MAVAQEKEKIRDSIPGKCWTALEQESLNPTLLRKAVPSVCENVR